MRFFFNLSLTYISSLSLKLIICNNFQHFFIFSIGITVFLISIAGYSISVHRKRIEVRPNKPNFNSNTNEEKA